MTTTVEHPARWSAAVLVELYELVAAEAERQEKRLRIIDPFCGVGRARLAETLPESAVVNVTGVELQPEWAASDPDGLTQVGDATRLPAEWTDRFDACVTSACYGNRLADSHDAQDACGKCGGLGCDQGCGTCTSAHDGPDSHKVCSTCRGHGFSRRNTYTHALARSGIALAEGSAAALQWGAGYRTAHSQAIGELRRVVVADGLLLVNMSNHVRGGVEQPVVEWWLRELMAQGCRVQEVRPVVTPRQRHGQNGALRAATEFVIAVRTPRAKGML